MQSEEENLLNVKGSKRTFKSPYQLEALEKFYREHMYPSESMKAHLSANLGLSDKQIQSWFCHRRSKDKKVLEDTDYGTMKNDLQSSVNDCCSGVRHDSCSSSKQGEHLYDFREVESRRFHSQSYLDSCSDLRERFLLARNYSVMDDTSSESTSASQELSQERLASGINLYNARSLGCATMDGEYNYRRQIPRKGYMTVSEESCMDGTNQHPSVVAVKLKLGKMYRTDGPLLGFEFQPLPPGAFDSPPLAQLNESYYVGDPIPQSFHSVPRSRNDSNIFGRFEKSGNVRHSNHLTIRESGYWRMQSSHDSPTRCPSLANQSNKLTSMHMQMDEYSDSEASKFISNESETRSRHGMKSKLFPASDNQNLPRKDSISIVKQASIWKTDDRNNGRRLAFPYQCVKTRSSEGGDEVDSTRIPKKAKMCSRWRNNEEDYPYRLGKSTPTPRVKKTGGKIWMPEDTSNCGGGSGSQMLRSLKGSVTDTTSSSTNGSEDTGSSNG